MDSNVTEYTIDGKKIYVLGTAHVSGASAEEAYSLIKEVRPDSVCIELDSERLNNLKNPKKWSDTDIVDVIKQKRVAFLLANIILSSYQKRLGGKLNSQVGQEMMSSIRAAEETGADIVTIDRNIRTTFLRIWRKMSFIGKIKLLFNLIFSFVDDEEITDEDLENLKTRDMLEAAMGELSGSFPELKRYLVDERDEYLANGIRNAPGDTVVAVVGAAHTIGIDTYIKEGSSPERIKEIDTVPAPGIGGRIIGWIIPALIIAMFAFTAAKDTGSFLEQLKQWIIYNGTFSALGVLLCGGHILSVLTAFVAAPITSLNPLLAAGWFAGLAQAKLVAPTVGDTETLADDVSTLRGFIRNRLTKVLLVVVMGNIGSVIGTFAAGIGMFSILLDLF
ncbi:MAG: TraB/GumN family protein [Eubacteriaceae bacterium]|nr:TraB/GumN family protein [Eubacteriaceae bacterium]